MNWRLKVIIGLILLGIGLGIYYNFYYNPYLIPLDYEPPTYSEEDKLILEQWRLEEKQLHQELNHTTKHYNYPMN